MNSLLILLASLPGVLISYAIFRADKYEREPLAPLLLCFVLGALLTIPAVRVEKWTFDLIARGSNDFWSTLLMAFGAVAFNEEVLKFAVPALIVLPRAFFNEPFDGIVYAVLTAMGFATLENINYADRFGAETVLLRMFTAVPAHLAFGIVQGYYIGLARFGAAKPFKKMLQGLLIAILLHGTYDFLIFQDWSDWLFVLGTLMLYLCLFYSSRLIKEHLDNSPFR